MPFEKIESIDDKRLDPYRHLRTRNLTRYSGAFIAESKLLVQRLIRSKYRIDSILIDDKQLASASEWLPESAQVYVVEQSQVDQLLGFNFHRGVLACGIREPLADVSQLENLAPLNDSWTGAMVIGVQDPENLGLIARSCSALGIQDLILGPECVDPLARRVLRVSMAGILNLRLYEAKNVVPVWDLLKNIGVRTVATSLQDRSRKLEEYRRSGPTLILLGNEANGLPEAVQNAADDCLKIDMCLGTDSLNVSVAAGIVMHYLTRLANPN